MHITEAKEEGNILKILAESAEVKAEYNINTFTLGSGKDTIKDFNMFSKNLSLYEIVYSIYQEYAEKEIKVLKFLMLKIDGKDETKQANDIIDEWKDDDEY